MLDEVESDGAAVRQIVGQARMIRYWMGMQLLIPQMPGVYWFFDQRGVLYAGSTISIRRRFCEHQDSPNPLLRKALAKPVGAPHFAWVEANVRDLEDLERILIRFFRPPCNRIRYVAR